MAHGPARDCAWGILGRGLPNLGTTRPGQAIKFDAPLTHTFNGFIFIKENSSLHPTVKSIWVGVKLLGVLIYSYFGLIIRWALAIVLTEDRGEIILT